MKKILAILILINATLLNAIAMDPAISVDFNVGKTRKADETNEPGYLSWLIDQADPTNTNTYTGKTATISGVTITLSGKAQDKSASLDTYWDKALVQTPNFIRFASDGVFVKQDDGGDKGGEISMKLEGLKTGTHTIMLFFNSTANASNTFAPIDIYIDEVNKARITPSCRVMKNSLAAYTFLTFDVVEPNAAVIRMTADASFNATLKNVYLCGFALNVPDAKAQIRNPLPSYMDEHVNADNGMVNLSWTATESGAESYNVYWGLDSAGVDNATAASSTFRGNQTATSYTLMDVKRMNSYYWRVDAVKGGVATKGRLLFFRPRVLAFPSAEGYGRYARGGRGGQVVYVTNLNNSGPGSLREAITSNIGPRYVVFATSGRIHINPGDRLTVNQNYITVAGQAAPGKGICVSGMGFGVTGDDVIMRFMRVRVGQFGYTTDGMGMTGADFSIGDHNSISWSHDEAFSSRGGKSFTLQNTLISEALNAANHKNYDYGKTHGFAGSIGGDTATFIRMLLAHCEGRNWSLAGGLSGDGYYTGHLEIANNVVYNYGGRVTDGGAHEVNFVNNYYKQGKHSTGDMLVPQHEAVGLGTQKYYAKGNVLEKYNNGVYGTFICNGTEPIAAKCGCTNSQWAQTRYEDFVSEPFFPSYATILPAKHAFKTVLSDCGANMPALDEHDLRVILETREGTWKYKGSYTGKQGLPDHHLDVGGYDNYPEIKLNLDEFDTDRDGLPNWWEIEVSKTRPDGVIGDFTDTNTDPDNDGNTHMERYLEFMATPHVVTMKKSVVSVELSQYTRGYTKSPVYEVETNGDGVVTINGNWARFQPNNEFSGVTYFTFKVTDSDGDTMVRKIGVRVKP